jgi:hypothetical protein
VDIIGPTNERVLAKAIERARARRIILPQFAQQKDPEKVPPKIVEGLREVGLWDLDPLNLFRITWKNEAKAFGGGFWRGQLAGAAPGPSSSPAMAMAL